MIIEFDEFSRARSAADGQQVLRYLISNIELKEGEQDGLTDEEFLSLCYCKRFCKYVSWDTIAGCIIGGAIGDALGLPVEFFADYQIFKQYGEQGITQLQLYGGVAHISDDTQMTLFTADGMLAAGEKCKNPTAEQYVQSIYESYLNWLYTQDHGAELPDGVRRSVLLDVQELHHQRAPGITCLNALRGGTYGTLDVKVNDSKGCGGIMRIAPIAMYLAQQQGYKTEDVALLAARAAAITHTHELGYIPAAYLAAVLVCIVRGDGVLKACREAERIVIQLFPNAKGTSVCLNLVNKAIKLACDDAEMDDLEAIRMLGEGWVAEETLAIAAYCALKYTENFERAMIAAVNHSGDSDSTGAVTGNILGAYWGLKRLPQHMVEPIELKNLMIETAKKMQINQLSTEVGK